MINEKWCQINSDNVKNLNVIQSKILNIRQNNVKHIKIMGAV